MRPRSEQGSACDFCRPRRQLVPRPRPLFALAQRQRLWAHIYSPTATPGLHLLARRACQECWFRCIPSRELRLDRSRSRWTNASKQQEEIHFMVLDHAIKILLESSVNTLPLILSTRLHVPRVPKLTASVAPSHHTVPPFCHAQSQTSTVLPKPGLFACSSNASEIPISSFDYRPRSRQQYASLLLFTPLISPKE